MFLRVYIARKYVTGSRQKLRIILGTAEGKKLHGRPRIDGRNMVERISKNGKREGLGTSGSVVGSCKRGKYLSRLTEGRKLLWTCRAQRLRPTALALTLIKSALCPHGAFV